VVLSNPGSVQDRDTFGRLLRFVDVGGRDAGLAQIRSGLGVARYDSRDRYDPHPREELYRRADQETVGVCER
jgi:endonuclease YncB( thermonuclease family)